MSGRRAIERREDLKAEREELADRLTELRTRVDRIEENAVEEFNEHMGTVLDILEYENLDRIWIERRETEVREGRRKVMRTRFDLHIVRSSPDGTAYEDTVDHLSESEREVTGLVFALAGYLVHDDVHETVPFILLDSLEAIDSDRIARVVDYFRTHADYLVAALLPGGRRRPSRGVRLRREHRLTTDRLSAAVSDPRSTLPVLCFSSFRSIRGDSRITAIRL